MWISQPSLKLTDDTWKLTVGGWRSIRMNLISVSKYIHFVSCWVFHTLRVFTIVFISLFLCVSLSLAFCFFLLWVYLSLCCCRYFAFTSHHAASVGNAADKSIDWEHQAEMLCWRLWMHWHSRMDTDPLQGTQAHTHIVAQENDSFNNKVELGRGDGYCWRCRLQSANERMWLKRGLRFVGPSAGETIFSSAECEITQGSVCQAVRGTFLECTPPPSTPTM